MMGGLDQAIDALSVLGPALQMVPILGDNLKAAVELASTICERAKVC
jgi:hypothetical protein